MILRILIVVALVIAAVLLFAATKPATLHIQRAIVINAPPERVFTLINDLHNWKDWGPDEKADKTVMYSFSGSPSGIGAASEWDSRGSAGKGQMMITESEPAKRVAVKVDFVKPFASHNLNEFTFEPAGPSTRLTWSWQGQNLYFMKVMGVFVSMDKMIGSHFDSGLQNLKAIAEK